MEKKTATEEYMDRERKSIYTTTVNMGGPVIKTGYSGPWFVDIEERIFLDFTSQVSLLNTGYRHPEVESFLSTQLKSLYSCISADWPFANEVAGLDKNNIEISRAALAEKLIELTDGIMPFEKKVLFEISGATAVNAAAYLCMAAYLGETGRWSTKSFERLFLHRRIFIPSSHAPFRFSFLGFKNAFHGRHGIAKLLTDSKAVHLWGSTSGCAVGRLTLPDGDCTEKDMIKEADYVINHLAKYAPVVAFFFEPVQGEGGINVPNKDGMNFLVEYLREKRGIYIIADEIQSGLGRTGKMFACEHFGIEPDMVILSKSLGAGLPIGAVVANSEKFPDLEPGMHSGSHHCPPMACAAAIANLDVIKRGIPHAGEMGASAAERLESIAQKFPEIIKEVRGLGLMLGVDFYDVNTRKTVIREAQKRGTLLASCGKSAICVYPPITIEKRDLDYGLNIFEEVLEDL